MKIEQLLDGIQKHFQEAGHSHNKWPIRAVVQHREHAQGADETFLMGHEVIGVVWDEVTNRLIINVLTEGRV